MNLTRFALDRRVILYVVIGLFALAGVRSYLDLPRAEDPGFLIRTAIVSVAWPGASAERVERHVAIPMEEELMELPGAKHVRTTVREGLAIVELDVEDLLPEVEPSWTEMREVVQSVMPTLPQGVIGPFINDDFGDVYGIVVAISGAGYSTVELERAAEELRRRVLVLDDARRVQIDGVQQRRVFIDYEPERLAALGVPAGYLVGELQTRNLVAPSGDVTAGTQRLALRTEGTFDSVDDVRNMAFRLPAGEVVALGDIATVSEGVATPSAQVVRHNGKPAVTVAVSMKADGKLTEFGPKVLEVVEQTRADLPAGLSFDLVAYQPKLVADLTSEFVSSLIQAVLIVIAVLLLALGVRTGLVVAVSIPLTMFVAFLSMQTFGITINQMSLTALIVALGLLVDNSIVISEQILSDTERGTSKREAALDATRTMAFPLFVASVCTAAALLPTYLAETSASEYTAALFEVLGFSLATSWLLAMTLIPVLCVTFLATGSRPSTSPSLWTRLKSRFGSEPRVEAKPASEGRYESKLYRAYRNTLLALLKRPWLSLGGFVIVLFVSFGLFGNFVPQQFFPTKQGTQFVVQLDFSYGTDIEEADRVTADLEAFMTDSLRATLDGPAPALGEEAEYDTPSVVGWASYIGTSAPRYTLAYAPEAPRPNHVYILGRASSFEGQLDVFERIAGYMERTHPTVTTRVQRVRNGPALRYPVEVRLSGPQPEVLERLATDLKRHMLTIGGVTNVATDWGRRQPGLDVEIDHEAARLAGLSSADVAFSLQATLDGIPLTQLQQGDDLIPVVLRSTDALAGAEALSGLQVYSQQTGRAVPFAQVAQAQVTYGPGNIKRYDGERTITVQADLALNTGPFVTPLSVVGEVEAYVSESSNSWPAGYTYAYGGDYEQSVDSQTAINEKFPIALIIILLLLVGQFNALRPPMIVLITLPFAFIGVTLGMLVSGYAFGFLPLLGTIALFGIIINNAVVLLDRIGSERERGLVPEQAVLHASQQRFRPILLTAATTAGGLIPLWIAGSPLFAPMAVAMLFGLVASSALTPGLVPILYALFYRLDFSNVSYDPDAQPVPADTETWPAGDGGSVEVWKSEEVDA
ncbi:MAG: efflux RND transporter permease subunit [Bacteroidota bacterium]